MRAWIAGIIILGHNLFHLWLHLFYMHRVSHTSQFFSALREFGNPTSLMRAGYLNLYRIEICLERIGLCIVFLCAINFGQIAQLRQPI